MKKKFSIFRISAMAPLLIWAACTAGSGLSAASGPATDIQKKAVLDFVNKMAGQQAPPGMGPAVEVVEELPSELAGMNLLKIKITMGPRIQMLSIYITADGKKAIPAQAVLDIESGRPTAPQDESYTDLPPGALDLTNQPSKGPADAKVTIVIFSDFQCPACRMHNENFEKTMAPAFAGKIRLVFLNFPLENIHPWAMPAAIAGECARKQSDEAFWLLHDKFFENQSEIVETNVLDKAISFLGGKIDAEAFKKCVENKETATDVEADMLQGRSVGLRGTPTYIVNNRLVPSGLNEAVIQAALDEAK